MAITPATAKLLAKIIISQLFDEEKRQRLVIFIVVGIVVFILILAMPIFLLTSTWENIKSVFGWESEETMKASEEYSYISNIKSNYGTSLEKGVLVFNGELPMPVESPVVTSEFGSRPHPLTRKSKLSYWYRFIR